MPVRSQLNSRIYVRVSEAFRDTLGVAAARVDQTMADYLRQAAIERMAQEEFGIAVLENELRARDGR